MSLNCAGALKDTYNLQLTTYKPTNSFQEAGFKFGGLTLLSAVTSRVLSQSPNDVLAFGTRWGRPLPCFQSDAALQASPSSRSSPPYPPR
jgi:hypothetical protein